MNPTQFDYLKVKLKGCQVDDIGCGSPSRLKRLLGDFDYLGIDKEHFRDPNTIQFNLEKPCPHLRLDTAFISWPITRKYIAWHLFLPNYSEVFYLGCNHSGTCCGDPDLWKLLSKREVLHVIPSPKETLIHYGKNPRPANAPTPREETDGIEVWNGNPPTQYNENPYV